VIGFIDKQRDNIKTKYPSFNDFNKGFQVTSAMIDDVVKAGEKEKIEKDEESLKVSGKYFARQIKALIARDLYEPGSYYEVMVEGDNEVDKAIEVLSNPKVYKKYLGK